MTQTMLRATALIGLTLTLGACATAAPDRSGFLSGYDTLQPRKNPGRAEIREYRDATALKTVQKVRLTPTVLAEGADRRSPLTPEERLVVLREIDAQLCFELSERFEIVGTEPADADVRAAVTWFEPTGRLASAASAASAFLIPGPIGLRVPGTLGGLGVEAEMRAAVDDRQIAAVAWARQAMAVGTDDPSLSRLGDALQFAEPFADAAAATMTPDGSKPRDIKGKADPCKAYGDRFQPGGMAAKFITKLYVPDSRGDAAPVATPPEK
jgi:hypothetical protein